MGRRYKTKETDTCDRRREKRSFEAEKTCRAHPFLICESMRTQTGHTKAKHCMIIEYETNTRAPLYVMILEYQKDDHPQQGGPHGAKIRKPSPG